MSFHCVKPLFSNLHGIVWTRLFKQCLSNSLGANNKTFWQPERKGFVPCPFHAEFVCSVSDVLGVVLVVIGPLIALRSGCLNALILE